MRFSFDHDYHIHSGLSSCSNDPEQTPERLLAYAKENGLTSICITDHFWDSAVPGASNWYAPQNFEHISRSKPLPKAEGIEFLFGCETDMDQFLTLGVAPETMEKLDFIVIPTTHLHMTGWTLSEEDAVSLKRRSELWVTRFEALLNMDLPFHKVGIAHIVCPLIARSSREDYLTVLDQISDEDMERLFKKAAELGAGIELNSSDMEFTDEEADIVLRPFRIAKKTGCKFYCGSDAHHPLRLDEAKAIYERAIDYLGLEESDKFHIGR